MNRFTKIHRASRFFMLAFFIINATTAQEIEPLNVFGSEYDEHQPIIHDSGAIYFTKAFHPENRGGKEDPGDIWYAAPSQIGVFQLPVVLKEMSTAYYDLLIGFLAPDTALVYHDNLLDQQVLSKYHKNQNGQWEKGDMVSIPGFKIDGSHFSARLHASGRIMVMAMKSFGSYGNEDLYISKMEGNQWSRPLNLGPTLNTFQQELSPFLSEDGHTLFFSSNAHGAEDGKQVYVSHRLDDQWTNWTPPKTLPLPSKDGMNQYYVEDPIHQKAYYTNTQTSDGYGNIMYLGEGEFPLMKSQMDWSSQNLPEKSPLKEEDLVISSEAQENRILEKIETKADSTSQEASFDEIFMDLEPGATIPLDRVFFKRGSADLVDVGSADYIRALSKYLLDHPEINVLLEGHTDSYGSARLNKELSINRANTIRNIMVEAGVPFERINATGWGGDKPIASNQTPEGREKNRRVEMVILEK
ncbi:MAG: OmpA family protein [Cyclobacteriaceae bacterium]